ncbi:hypothetical protein [Flavivirga sp. MEBiC07777]|nr:hypothetical protein [Flavivirga sp. MEBiC07777]
MTFNLESIWLYKEIIELETGKNVTIGRGEIYINLEKLVKYTSKDDYFFVMGITDIIHLIQDQLDLFHKIVFKENSHLNFKKSKIVYKHLLLLNFLLNNFLLAMFFIDYYLVYGFF